MSKKVDKEKNQHIQVFVRCRPLSAKEKKQGGYGVIEVSEREVHVKERSCVTAATKTFNFDKVFGPHSRQIDIYKYTVLPLVNEVLSGYNCTLFAYGQTGTGKTFTMEGERSDNDCITWEDDPLSGIIPRAMHQLFTRLAFMGCEFSVRVSYLEIYNEELIDLLGAESVENPRLRIYEDSARKGSCIIQGLEEVVVRDKDEVYKIMELGSQRRQTAATQMNAHSSRSHSLFMVTVHIKENSVDGEEMLKTGKFNLVDLAGSECIGRSGASEKRAREAGNINQSLLTLGRVITALLEHAPHVPYRESKLTRLLQDSLGGRTKTSIIATITPASLNIEETLNTLDYAFRAKNITNRPEINQRLSKKTLLKEYNEEIERLRRDLQAARDKNGVYLAQENYDELQTKIQQQRDAIIDFTERISLLTNKMMKITEMFDETKDALANTENKLTETKGELKHTEGVLDKTRLNYQINMQDCDEQRYLVSKHLRTEETLSSEATKLLVTAEEATADLANLHAKLDRKREVEKVNSKTLENFRVSFQRSIEAMKSNVRTFTEGQVMSATTRRDALANLLMQRTGEVAGLCGHLGQLVATLSGRVERLEKVEEANLGTAEEWSIELKTNCLQSKDAEVNRQKEFHEDTFLVTMVDIQTALQQHVASLQKLATTQEAQMDIQQAKINSFAADFERSLQKQSCLAQNMISAMETSFAEHKRQIHHTVNSQTSLDKELADNFMVDVSKLLTDMVTARQENLVSEMGNVEVTHNTMLGHLDHFNTEASSGIVDAVALAHRSLNDMTTLLASQNKQSMNTIRKECAVVKSVMEQQQQLETQVTASSNESLKHFTNRTRHLQKMIDKHTDALYVTRAAHKKGIESAVEDCKSAVEGIKAEQVTQHTAFAEDLGLHRIQLDEINKETTEWGAQMSESLQRRDSDIDHLLTEGLCKDNPTGWTPDARSFQYPRALSNTDRHSMILEDFRRSYVLRNVMDLPLPVDSSFNSVCSEVGVLDLDADIDQNASADSAFSTASCVSSTTMSEQPELEEQSSAPGQTQNEDTEKENNMKPPKVATVVKSQKVTTKSRSRSRTERDRLPSNRDHTRTVSDGRTPKKGAPAPSKTPTSKPAIRQSRTRLPLRMVKPEN